MKRRQWDARTKAKVVLEGLAFFLKKDIAVSQKLFIFSSPEFILPLAQAEGFGTNCRVPQEIEARCQERKVRKRCRPLRRKSRPGSVAPGRTAPGRSGGALPKGSKAEPSDGQAADFEARRRLMTAGCFEGAKLNAQKGFEGPKAGASEEAPGAETPAR